MNKRIKHGLSYHPLYSILTGMKIRCYDENSENYHNYGGRGIKICDEWMINKNYKGLKSFVKWAEESGYSEGLSIERVDVNGDYSPQNCTFITMAEQQKNKQTTRRITIKGVTKCLSEWSRLSGLGYTTILRRICAGWDNDDLLSPLIVNRAEKQSGIVGITWNTTRERWKVNIYFNGGSKFFGWFKNIEEAKDVHRKACYENNVEIKYDSVI